MKKLLVPDELQTLTYLKPRLKLTPESELRLQQLENGYTGESYFHKTLMENLSKQCLPLFDLLLESDGSLFQIDCLILCHDIIYMYEVKNYVGDYFIQNNRWYIVRTNKEIRNPLMQLERGHYLLNELIHEFPERFDIKSFIVFVNEAFTLYQAPLNTSIIFPTQIMREIKMLNRQAKFNVNLSKQNELAEWIIEQQVKRNFANIPEYSFDSLKKGVFCRECLRTMRRFSRVNMICHACKQKEDVEAAVLRNVKQFQTLFPEKRITTNTIFQWCGQILSQKVILRILKKHFKLIKQGRYSYFMEEDGMH